MPKHTLIKKFKITTAVVMLSLFFQVTVQAIPVAPPQLLPSAVVAETLDVVTTSELIDANGDVGKFTSLALDSSGHVHMSYHHETDGSGSLKYATNASGIWVIQVVDTFGYAGLYSSLKIDSADKIHITYVKGFILKYATNLSGNWVITTLDNNSHAGANAALALDANDKVHVVYNRTNFQTDTMHLKYVTNVSGSWVRRTLSGNSVVEIMPAIAVDGQGAVHVSYLFEDNNDLTPSTMKYTTNKTGQWITETADTCGYFSGAYSSILMDSSGNPNISYYDSTFGSLRFTRKTNNVWNCTRFDTNANVNDGLFTSLVLDADDNIYISYHDASNGVLKFMTGNNNTSEITWNSTTLDANSQTGQYTSLAQDENGNFHVGYYDVTNRDLRYMQFVVNDDVPWYADADGDGFGNPDVVLLDGSPPQGYVANATDCDDANGLVYPDATEICADQIDNNCDGNLNEGCLGDTQWDDDGDGFSEDQGDCHDANAAVFPGASEICDGIDNDCNDRIDEYDSNVTGAFLLYMDADHDGYGDAANPALACSRRDYYVVTAGDCDDANAGIHPAAEESCDGLDNNCNAEVDENNICPTTDDADSLADTVATGVSPSEDSTTPSSTGAGRADQSLGACSLSVSNNGVPGAYLPFFLAVAAIMLCRFFCGRQNNSP